MIYEDIDASLEENIRGDFSSIKGIVNVVQNNLYNNLQIGSAEIPFENTERPSLDDIIHSTSDIKDIMVHDVIEYHLIRDDRVKKIKKIVISNDNESELIITVIVQLDTIKEETKFNIKISKL